MIKEAGDETLNWRVHGEPTSGVRRAAGGGADERLDVGCRREPSRAVETPSQRSGGARLAAGAGKRNGH
jgi:hypothetical protein